MEHVRRCFEAYLRGDYATATEFLAPDVVWGVGQELPAHGPAAIRNLWKRWNSDWDELELVAEEYIDAGDEVVVAVRYRGRGRHSGVEVKDQRFEVFTFRDGRCIRKVDYRERSEALEAVGLAE